MAVGNARVIEASEPERERFVPRLTVTDADDACVLLDALTYYEDNENLSDATRVETRDLRRAIADELYLIVKAHRENEPDLTSLVGERDPVYSLGYLKCQYIGCEWAASWTQREGNTLRAACPEHVDQIIPKPCKYTAHTPAGARNCERIAGHNGDHEAHYA